VFNNNCYIKLNRKFIPVNRINENKPENMMDIFVEDSIKYISWDDLLKKNRVVVLAEPGTGKTLEFETITKQLRKSKHYAFFCRIELLQYLDIKNCLDIDTAQKLDEWLSGNQEGYFFLDSVDEARLKSHSAFEIALRKFKNTIHEKLDLSKIFVSCRVSNWRARHDLSLFLSIFPDPNIQKFENFDPNIEDSSLKDKKNNTNNQTVFKLLPLNKEQIEIFVKHKDINNTEEFMDAIDRSGTLSFAERPQDLLDLIVYWKSNGHFGRYQEMLDFNIQKKLVENNPDFDDIKSLSKDMAILGAERLAAEMTLQKKSSILLPDTSVDIDLSVQSIEAKEALSDWSPKDIHILLNRPIFDVAIYGTVKFHHRSIQEYLMAQWLNRLIKAGKPIESIENLFFTRKYERDVVVPSMRAIASWLALRDDRILNRLWEIAPETLVENGDPSALPIENKKKLLESLAEFYAEHNYSDRLINNKMIGRLADNKLASTINDLLQKYRSNDQICMLLLSIIRQGQISESAEVALTFAIDENANEYIRSFAIHVVDKAGTRDQQLKIFNTMIKDITKLSSNIIGEFCIIFFPKILSVQQLISIIKQLDPPKNHSFSNLLEHIETLANNDLSDEELQTFLKVLYTLLKTKPFIEEDECHLSKKYAWLIETFIKLGNQLIRKKNEFSLDRIVLDIYFHSIKTQDFSYLGISLHDKLFQDAKKWPTFQYQLFWYAISSTRNSSDFNKTNSTTWFLVRHYFRSFWKPESNDLEQFFKDMDNKPSIDDRSVALSAIFFIYENEGKPYHLLEQIKQSISGKTELKEQLKRLLEPKPVKQFQTKNDNLNKRIQSQKHNIKKYHEQIIQNPQKIKHVGNPKNGEVNQQSIYLYDFIKRNSKNKGLSRLTVSNWRFLIDEFSEEVAINFRDGCIAYWREYDPSKASNRRTNNEIPHSLIIGLTGIAMEADIDQEWINKISHNEAKIAAHYCICEINGFPEWFQTLHNAFPDEIYDVIEKELRWEMHEAPEDKAFFRTLSSLQNNQHNNIQSKDIIFRLLLEKEPANNVIFNKVLSFLLKGNVNMNMKKNYIKLACKGFSSTLVKFRKINWLVFLVYLDGILGYELLKKWIDEISEYDEQKKTMRNFCANLFYHRRPLFDTPTRDFERIEVLEKLLPLIFQYVTIESDQQHEGAYFPDQRDLAQENRYLLFSIACEISGQKSHNLLIKLSEIVTEIHTKNYFKFLAKEMAAKDSELKPWTGKRIEEFSQLTNKQLHRQKEHYRLFLASPGDVVSERNVVDEVVRDLNFNNEKFHIDVIRWENHAAPNFGRPQQVIFENTEFYKTDIFVGIFWARIGTPTGKINPDTGVEFISGTVEEFSAAIKLLSEGKIKLGRFMLYFCKRSVPQNEANQYKEVEKFRKDIENNKNVLFFTYENIDIFKYELLKHLNQSLC
jgi:hypothetical protein